MDACKEAHYRYYHDWEELEDWQKAKLVAHYILSITIENNREDARASKIEQDSHRGGRR